ncbi:MAG: methyltransferase [Nitrospirota bacterium]|nr:methyltransferase [Nitrospirota bacterium]
MATETLSHSQSMIRLLRSYIATRVIYVAAKLGLADHIRDDGASAQDLAQKLNVHPGALYRVMRTLAGLGVLHQDEHDRFFVTQFGETLRKDSPQSVRDYAIFSHEFVYEIFRGIMDSVRTGKPVIEDFFEYLRANPEQEAIFHTGMATKTRIETVAVIEAYDFSKCGTVVDVGGGNGAFLSGILASCEQVSGVLFDQKSAIEAAKASRGGSLPRCRFVAGDFFEAVPSGGDTYVLKRTLYNWSDEEVVQILKNCRKAMKSQTRLLIIEPLIGPPNEQCTGHLSDMNFLLMGGRVRTEEEYSNLLRQTGFRLQKKVPTESDDSVLEAVAA